MNQIEHRIRLDVLKDSVQAFLRVFLNDTRSRKLIISLMEGSSSYPLYGVTTAALKARKPDGTILFNSCEVGNTAIIYEITAQTTAAAGDVECELVLYGEGGGVLASPKFKIIVAETIVSDSEVESTNEFTALTEAIQAAEEFKTPYTAGDGINISNKVISIKKAENGTVGGIKAIAKTTETVPVAVDADGKAWVPRQSGTGTGGGGADGTSAYASVTQTDDGAIITCTDASGTTTATIQNGKDGVNTEILAVQDTEPEDEAVKMWVDNSEGHTYTAVEVNSLTGKTLVSFGDSIAAGQNNSAKGYAHLIAERNGMTLTSYAVSGAGVGPYGTSVLSQLQNAAGTQADFVLLEGGYNDCLHQDTVPTGSISTGYDATLNPSTFCGALESLLKLARQTYTDAQIVYVIVHKAKARAGIWEPYAQLIRQACEKWSVPCVDLCREGGLNGYLPEMIAQYTDTYGTHPNEAGYLTWYVPPIEAVMKRLSAAGHTGGNSPIVNLREADGTFSPLPGIPGLPGAAGPKGNDGITPHIGDNGNWWIGNTDTGTSASGVDPNAPYIGTFDIPGLIPDGVQKISQYTVNGGTASSAGGLANASGSMTAGSQTINLPTLGEWDTLTAQAEGTGIVSRRTSAILALKDMGWGPNPASFNDTSVYFIGSTLLEDAGTHEDNAIAEDIVCNVLPNKRVSSGDGILSPSTTTPGIAVGGKNMLRCRVSRQSMLDAGCSESEVESGTGFVKWCTANHAAVVYRKETAVTEQVTLTPLTATSGMVTLSGGYKGGTMTAARGNPGTGTGAYATVEQTDDGAVITCTDANGTTTATVTNGTTPHIGDNGNWWIGETDTGGDFDIPGTIPERVESIKEYTINGLSNTAGSMTVGEQVIALPALDKWDTLTATAKGNGTISRRSVKKMLNEFTWTRITSFDDNGITLLFGVTDSNQFLDAADLPNNDGMKPECIYSPDFPSVSAGYISNPSRTDEGIACKNTGALRLRVLASKLNEWTIDTVVKLTDYLTQTGAYIVYKAVEPATEQVTLPALTAASGTVTLSEEYSSGVMTAQSKVEELDLRMSTVVQDVIDALPDGDGVSY